MSARRIGALWTWLLAVLAGSAQAPPPSGPLTAYIEIRVPAGVPSETIFVRYFLDDDFGGWVQPRRGVSSYFISTLRQGIRAARFRALIWAPGCAIQTLDVPIGRPRLPGNAFECQPLSNIKLTGTLIRSDRLNQHEISVQAKYLARRVQRLLSLDDGLTTDIPVGGTPNITEDGSFQLSLPDFSKDPMAGASNSFGALQILASDRTTGNIVARLVPTVPSLRTRMGGLQIRREYPEAIEFAPCFARLPQMHDAFGFAIRPDEPGACAQ